MSKHTLFIFVAYTTAAAATGRKQHPIQTEHTHCPFIIAGVASGNKRVDG